MDQDAPRAADRTTRRLVVVRHAQAEGSATSDEERVLTARGRRDARAAGGWLGARVPGPDDPRGTQGLVSSARRAVETWDQLVHGSGWQVEAAHDEGLYVAGPDAALDLVRATSSEVTTLVLVGHNPTMGYLAPMLDDGEGDDEAATSMATSGFPTCTLAVLALEGAWADLEAGGARLEAFHVARADD